MPGRLARSASVPAILFATFAVLVTLGGAPNAQASCPFITEETLFRGADVVLDGVVLSGPRAEGDMASPARVAVARYLKGHGPAVVRVGTNVPQVTSGDLPASFGVLAEDVRFWPGPAFRIFGRTPSGGPSAAKGILAPAVCGGTGRPALASRLRPVVESAVAVGIPGAVARWRAKAFRGPGAVSCVIYAWGRGGVRDGECEKLEGPRSLLLGVRTALRGRHPSTAIVAAGPGLQRIELSVGGATFGSPARGRGRISLFAFNGVIDPDALTIHAFFKGGREAVIDHSAHRAMGADPEGLAPFKAVAERGLASRRHGFVCVRWQPTDSFFGPSVPFLISGECGDIIRSPFFFAVRGVRRFDDSSMLVTEVRRVLFGAVGDQVARVTVTGPDGPRELELARRGPGGAFIAAYPGAVSAADLAVTFELRDGSRTTYSGLSELGVEHNKIPLGGRGFG